MKAIFTVVILGSVSIGLGTFFTPVPEAEAHLNAATRQDEDKDQDKRNIREKARQVFMRGKLDSNKMIVEGLSTNNFEKIEKGAAAVKALTKGQHWFVLDTQRYKQYSKQMESAASLLEEAAKNKNMDAAALRYFGLTMNCLDCHRYIEERKQ